MKNTRFLPVCGFISHKVQKLYIVGHEKRACLYVTVSLASP